jgi:hypothetical protein
VKRAYARIAQNIRNGKSPLEGFAQPGDARTIKEGVDMWLSVPRGRKASTIGGYVDNLRGHILPALGAKLVTELTPEDCERFILNVKPCGDRKKPLTERTKQSI